MLKMQEALEREIGIPPRIIDHTGYETPHSKAMRANASEAYNQKLEHAKKVQRQLEERVKHIK
jgi:hypothetical protein